jgi:hypothetical protein
MFLSGGGVLTSTQATARYAEIDATGGGTAAVSATSGEDHNGIIVITGGGVASLSATSARSAAVVARAGGVLVHDVTTSRSVAIALVGAGLASIGRTSERFVSPVATGAGIATLAIYRPDAPLGLSARMRPSPVPAAIHIIAAHVVPAITTLSASAARRRIP